MGPPQQPRHQVGGGGGGGRRRALVEEDATLDGLAADGTLAHAVAAQLAGAVSAHEDHVLQAVQADGTHGLHGGTTPHRARSVSSGFRPFFRVKGKPTPPCLL